MRQFERAHLNGKMRYSQRQRRASNIILSAFLCDIQTHASDVDAFFHLKAHISLDILLFYFDKCCMNDEIFKAQCDEVFSSLSFLLFLSFVHIVLYYSYSILCAFFSYSCWCFVCARATHLFACLFAPKLSRLVFNLFCHLLSQWENKAVWRKSETEKRSTQKILKNNMYSGTKRQNDALHVCSVPWTSLKIEREIKCNVIKKSVSFAAMWTYVLDDGIEEAFILYRRRKKSERKSERANKRKGESEREEERRIIKALNNNWSDVERALRNSDCDRWVAVRIIKKYTQPEA